MNRKSIVFAVAVLLALAPAAVFAHGKGQVHVKGTITATAPDHLTVKTPEGKEIHITLTSKTEFLKGKTPATATDAKVGSRVVVHLGKDGNAAHVQLPEEKPKK